MTMIALAQLLDRRGALVIVKPETFIKWHRSAFRIFWSWKSGPRIPTRRPSSLERYVSEPFFSKLLAAAAGSWFAMANPSLLA